MSCDLAYVAIGHKIWLGNLTADMCNPEVLGPLLERPPGTQAANIGAERLPLRDLQISKSRRCAVATFKTRLAAATALRSLDRKTIDIPMLEPRQREISACWALKHPTLRLYDLSNEVTREHLERAFATHGELFNAPNAVEIEFDEDGSMTGRAYVRYLHRGTAARVAQMCAENLLIIAGSMLPVSADFPPGALDDDNVPDMKDGRAPHEAGRDLMDCECDGWSTKKGANKGGDCRHTPVDKSCHWART